MSPKGAFLRSLALPGWGQTALERPTAAGVFALLEFVSVTMIIQSKQELHLARRFSRDSVVVSYDTTAGLPGTPVFGPGPLAGRVRPRKQHVEDWIAVLLANHLFSGADAFVSAHLWDLDAEVSALPAGRGVVIAARILW